jgi:hypothetical protein
MFSLMVLPSTHTRRLYDCLLIKLPSCPLIQASEAQPTNGVREALESH